jgi:hypothetical protein
MRRHAAKIRHGESLFPLPECERAGLLGNLGY